MKYWIKYGATAVVSGGAVAGTAFIFPEKSFLAFVIGWLFLLPAVFAGYMVYGYWKYMMERKHSMYEKFRKS